MSLFLPLLRADFYATESYHYDSPDVCPPLRTPALLLCGSHDREASPGSRSMLASVAEPRYRPGGD